MNENFEIAFYLMVTGMFTVFIILLLVVILSGLLIQLVNKYGPAIPIKQGNPKKIDSKQVAILTAVVDHLTSGKGEIADIKKLSQ